jgi:hypothetical protein
LNSRASNRSIDVRRTEREQLLELIDHEEQQGFTRPGAAFITIEVALRRPGCQV